MVSDPKNPIGPGNFTRDGHRVAIAEDGKILVRKDDWLSKYSWALYGTYDRLDEFVRPNPKMHFPAEVKGIQEIEDVNRIDTGEYLVHVPTYFDWMEKRGKPSIGVPRKRPRPKPEQGIDPNRLERFLRYVKQWLCPVNDWSVVGTGGLDLSAWMFCAHYCSIGVQRTQDPDPTWYHALGAGVGIGPEDVIGSLSWSPSELPSAGFIGKFPWAGRTLSADEICGNYWFIDLSGGCFEGASVAIMFFGANAPPHALMRTAVGYLRGEGSDALTFPSIFNGALLMAGLNLTTPAVGVSFKMGWMHRKECVTGKISAQLKNSLKGSHPTRIPDFRRERPRSPQVNRSQIKEKIMLRTFRPALETLENREVFAAGPLAGGLMPGLAVPHSGAQENLAAMVASNRTETVNNNETITIHANRAATLTAAPVFRAVHDAAAHDALFTDLGNAGNDPAQIIAILIGMAKSSTNDALANSMGSNLDALPVAGSRASDAQFSFQGAATDGASNQSSLLANQEYYNLNPTTSRPKALQSSSSQSQIIAVLIGL